MKQRATPKRKPEARGRGLRITLLPLLAVAGLAVLVMFSGGMDRLIESQVFFPETVLVENPGQRGLDYEDVWITASDGVKIHGWLAPAAGARELILFFHGNAGNISHRVDNLARLHRINAAVLIIDYRGYGQSWGRISEAGMYLDAEAAYAFAHKRAEAAGQRLVIFGRSLGGVAAVHVAAGRPCHGLILESTFTNLGDMASAFFPLPGVGRMVSGRMDSLAKVPAVAAPKLFLHGDRDDLVPFKLGRRLFEAAAEPKEWVTLAGAGHNDTYYVGGHGYWQKWRAFLDRLPQAEAAPQP